MRKKFISIIFLFVAFVSAVNAQQMQVRNPFIWADAPDPDIIRVGDYYYLVTTTMHLFPGAPIMRSTDLVHWETVSYLFDKITDTPRYDLEQGTVYGRGQWATSLRYHKGTFWALFVANDDPHKSMVFKTDDPAKGWKLHSRLPAYHDSSLFFDDDDRVYVFSGSGDIHLVELTQDLTAEKVGGIRKTLELKGKPAGLHEGSRVIKHDGMYYLLCISWPQTGRQEICYRSSNIEGPYESKVILKSDFGGFPYAGQGTIVNGKKGEWYGVIFQDRGGCGRVLTIEPCNWVDGWPMLGNLSDGKIPETMTLDGVDKRGGKSEYAVIEQDYQWNHNLIQSDVKILDGHLVNGNKWTRGAVKKLQLKTSKKANSIFDARNTLTWRTWGPLCTDTVCIDASKMKDGDVAGLAALNGDTGFLSLRREGGSTYLIFSEENVALSDDTKAITKVDHKEIARVKIPASKLKNVRMVMNGDFNPGRDIATFSYSLDGKKWNAIGGDYKMRFDYRRLFMGSRYAFCYYSTKSCGGMVTVSLPK
ncbi:MAG: family 43 glycosylhydrolase [Bacteroidaceae bacterium]|nr:family 43 glycosylhydrolase [Bacteroidaceae bacterium]